jgi:hypothetical protein
VTRNIPLASLTHIEPDPKRQNCLVIQYSTSTFSILFRDNSELYTWLDALYLRSSLSTPIGMPTNFVHRVHVGFNAMTGGFTVGLDSSSIRQFFTDDVFSRVYRLTGKPSSIPPSLQDQPLSPYRRQTPIERFVVSPGSRRSLHPPPKLAISRLEMDCMKFTNKFTNKINQPNMS